MTRAPDPAAEIGPGVLSRAASVVHWFVVVEALLVLTAVPALVPVLLLAGDASNAPLIGLCLVPLAPGLSAALFTWRVFGTERDLAPARHFWRGYRLNLLDVLRWWLPVLALLTVIGSSLANLGAAGVPTGYGVVLVLIAVVVLLFSAHALVLSSALSLRTRDVALLALHYLAARPRSTLGVLSLLVTAAGIVVLTSEGVLLLLASPLTLALLRNADPVLRDAVERFTA
ncbi:DUF624 domain-containing protein [Umezawaea beigongshangensis]|uniref:DUF624 domain-containing protein n=1 Tax=Umezawaea beigongshangensis TaxID=2780383 RepID=UPI0018F227FF|nr:DUF624 domain-containing protein [Umezawaea beigongshangensis]